MSALGPFVVLCRQRAGYMGTHMTNVLNMCWRYVGSAIWRRSVKKNPGKTYRGKTTGGGWLTTTPSLYKG